MFVGIDAGGTRTRLVLADAEGTLVGATEAGPGNYQVIGPDGLSQLICRLLEEAGPTDLPEVLCAGVAGAGRRPEQEELRDALEQKGLARTVRVVTDARAALEGAHRGAPGVVCIAGTGSIVVGRNAEGYEARAGGWGPTLGDEGSAHGLVMQAIRSVLRAVDGSGPDTSLQADLLVALGLADWHEIIQAIYGGAFTRDRIAAACPVVFAAARNNDEVALRVVHDGFSELGAKIGAVARRLKLAAPVVVACTGGVFGEPDLLEESLAAGASDIELELTEPQFEARFGALLLAMSASFSEASDAAMSTWS
ncbi:MAG: BadF/BadG/BcrA/BcrD ATPase family protein [Candidatus Latescibacteria bacterium]|nr:BadF/BadG/BcrA/BcrD ATPase family protein [Candidatus Latescibacterota bacterium]MDP7449296.1 BadF/BadG/BcrA/BcrD ATPase family protein [Candidatus Latescibacterota bacterium]HJP33581.1 BadF/BadG/BcrA/BcrD ATPase family protein [Candidatus Latescibacterota bacterium]